VAQPSLITRLFGKITRLVGKITRLVGKITCLIGETTNLVGKRHRCCPILRTSENKKTLTFLEIPFHTDFGKITHLVGKITHLIGETTRLIGKTTKLVGKRHRCCPILRTSENKKILTFLGIPFHTDFK
jgi:hypothetical protein